MTEYHSEEHTHFIEVAVKSVSQHYPQQCDVSNNTGNITKLIQYTVIMHTQRVRRLWYHYLYKLQQGMCIEQGDYITVTYTKLQQGMCKEQGDYITVTYTITTRHL